MLVYAAAILREDETPVPEETKVTFYAAAELGVGYLSLEL
jgi:hypothetical protein